MLSSSVALLGTRIVRSARPGKVYNGRTYRWEFRVENGALLIRQNNALQWESVNSYFLQKPSLVAFAEMQFVAEYIHHERCDHVES